MNSLFISTHFDDAVFSCGKLIAVIEHPTVLTVFGGVPQNKQVCTAYDQKSGFETAEQAVLARRDEDSTALSLLGAEQVYLEFVDSQYDQKQSVQEIREKVAETANDYDEIYLPLGFMHPDHETVGSLTKFLVKTYKDKTFYIYFDLPYYVDSPILATETFTKSGFNPDYEYRGGDLGKKMLAINCYKSQVPITNIFHLMADERFYRIK